MFYLLKSLLGYNYFFTKNNKMIFQILAILFSFPYYSYANVLVDTQLIFNDMKELKWGRALEKANISRSQALIKIVKSKQYADSKYNGNTFLAITNFVYENPTWPGIYKVIRNAENYIDENTDSKLVYQWFSKYKPKTSIGHKYYIQSSIKHCNNSNALNNIIKRSWTYGYLSPLESQKIISKHKNINTSDVISRINYTIDNLDSLGSFKKDQVQYIKSLIDLQSMADKKRLNMKLNFALNQQGALNDFNKLSKKEQLESKNLLAYLKYLRKNKKNCSDQTYQLLLASNSKTSNTIEWSNLRLYFARELMWTNNFAKAYKIISMQNVKDPTSFLRIQHLCGFLAYKLKKYDTAIAHFKKCENIARLPISISRAKYWLGRSYFIKKDRKSATSYFQQAAKYSYTFFGQIAMVELGRTKLVLPAEIKIKEHEIDDISYNDLAKAIPIVIKHDSPERAAEYSEKFVQHFKTNRDIATAIKYVKRFGSVHATASAARIAMSKGIFMSESFPDPYQFSNILVEKPLIYAVIRQETTFNYSAIDHLNGRGLMQIMPYTCLKVAKQLNIQCDSERLIIDPAYNMQMGIAHLHDYISQLDGSYLFGIPAYNAGVHRLKQWIAALGDPRKEKSTRAVVDWIELVPYGAVRRYIYKVFENLEVFRTLLGDSKLQIKQDLLK